MRKRRFAARNIHGYHVSTREIVEQMSPVLKLTGCEWYEITGDLEAAAATTLSATAIAHFYEREFAFEGRHPRRWFFLLRHDRGEYFAPVALCVTPQNVRVENPTLVAETHTTGWNNSNPYPKYALHIAELGRKLGLDIRPNYKGHPLEAAEAENDNTTLSSFSR